MLSSSINPEVGNMLLKNIERFLQDYKNDIYGGKQVDYQQIGNEAYVEYKLKNTLEQHDILDGFDSELTNKIVKLIRLAESGSVSIILINDQEIRKEQSDHANSSPNDTT